VGDTARGQLSLETLLVFTIFISLLGISYTATSKVGEIAQKKMVEELAKRSFEDFSAKLSSACSLGNGNIRTAEIRGDAAKIESNGRGVLFSTKSFSSQSNSSCEITVLQAEPASSFTIENKQGKIEIS
jgi:hypothetical protein